MEMFGNPITGYTTEFYSALIESMSQSNEIFLGNIHQTKGVCNGNGCHVNGTINYSGDRGVRNSSSQICQEGLEIRAKNLKAKKAKMKKEFKIKKILIPKWRYFNKDVFGEL
jgi:hypothetical protein